MVKTNTPAKGKAEIPPSTLAKVEPISSQIPTKTTFTDLKPLEDRLHRLDELFDLQRKYVTLQQSKQKLASFKLSHDGESAYLKLLDDDRNDFTTSNPAIMREVVQFISKTIDAKIKEIEPLLNW